MHTVKSCCGKFSLRDGTLALLISYLINQIVVFIYVMTLKSTLLVKILLSAVTILSVIGIPVVGILGVLKEKPTWLIPYITTQMIGVGDLVLLMVVLLFGGPPLLNSITEFLTSDPDGKHAYSGSATGGTVFLIEIVIAIAAGFMYYCFVVVLSYYGKLKRESQARTVQNT